MGKPKFLPGDHVIIHNNNSPINYEDTEAKGVGMIEEINHIDRDTYSIIWLDKEGMVRDSLAWVKEKYLEKTDKPFDFENIREEKPLDEEIEKGFLDFLEKSLSEKGKTIISIDELDS